MATTITNQSSTTYQFADSTETLTTTSNTNQIILEDFQGLTITKSSNISEFSVGEIVTYTIRITNNSSQFFNGVRIIDNLGSGNLAYVLGSARLTTSTETYPVTPIATNPLTFTLQQLNVGATMTLTYNAQVIFNLPTTIQSITNTVQGIGYTSTGTITGFASNTIQKKTNNAFVISKASSQTNVLPNQIFSYTLTLTNGTDTSATISNITDQLPSNFVVTSVQLRIGNTPVVELSSSDYIINGTNLITIPSTTGPSINVPANGITIVSITGYFI